MPVGNHLQACGARDSFRIGAAPNSPGATQREEPLEREKNDDDALRTSKGILLGLMLGGLCWAVLVACLWLSSGR